jgi:hypothetical protein
MEWNQEQFYKHDHKRGVCKGFTFGSRRRMLDRLNQVSVSADLPDFITLTLPDECFEDSATAFAKTAKQLLDVHLKRLHRACPSACGFWRIEWKARKSGLHEGRLFPHFHLLVWGLMQRSLGDFYKVERETGEIISVEERFESCVHLQDSQLTLELVRSLASPLGDGVPLKEGEGMSVISSGVGTFSFRGKGRYLARCSALVDVLVMERVDPAHPVADRARNMTFFDWVSLAWYHVVGSGNPDHLKAGCRVEKIRSWGGVLSYCAKYMSKADSENFMADIATGRSWGIFNRAYMPWAKMVEIPLDDEAGIRLRRVARHYLERRLGRRVQRHFGITIYCDVASWKPLLLPRPPPPF